MKAYIIAILIASNQAHRLQRRENDLLMIKASLNPEVGDIMGFAND